MEDLSVADVHEEDHSDGQNIEEALRATIEEAEDEKYADVDLPCDPNDQVFDSLPSSLIIQGTKELGISLVCTHCHKEGSTSSLCICPGCGGRTYHRSCWDMAMLHIPMPRVATCAPPVKFAEYVWTSYLLHSKISSKQQMLLHRRDVWSTWFGVPIQQRNPSLYVYPRLQYIIENARDTTSQETDSQQYPSLVSFFGDTGSGKSTLIRALICNAANNFTDKAPIPGSNADRHRSTSGDVHLYSDPKTIKSEVPLLYADCEGLKGSDVSTATQATEGDVNATVSNYTREILKNHTETASRVIELQWARTIEVTTKLSSKVVVSPKARRSIVTDLYPRLLYAFSDVVCYITNNLRTTEAELMQLFEWAQNGHDRTVNQRVRPGLIIVINKDVTSLDEKWLDVGYATKTLLNNLELSTAFTELRAVWQKRGKELHTAEDLILRYYDSLRIICIPSLIPTTTHMIASQYQKLYHGVRTASEEVRRKKIQLKMNLNVPSFNKYMEHAFSRLAKDLTSSIDFHYLASKDAARPTTFREYLLVLLVKLKDKVESEECKLIEEGESEKVRKTVHEAEIVARLTPFVARCIASQIPKDGSKRVQEAKIDAALRRCRQTLERFRDTAWRCEAMSNGARCQNYWVGHGKGHQFFQGSTIPSLQVGEFQCTFTPEEVILALYAEIVRVLEEGVGGETTMSLVAKSSGVSNVNSNWTCFTCLSQCPVYILPCEQVQHSICENCAVRFSNRTTRSQSTLFLEHCPLGCQFKQERPWCNRVKPSFAGVRLLSLDGGGVRGIIELSILREIVTEVGFGIPIQELFDLVIGTSTGGIIALGLFKMNWTIESARDKFEGLSHRAFSVRKWLEVPIFRHAAQLLYSHKFESEGVDSALREAFGQEYLFGYNDLSSSDIVKVGVVAGVPGDRRPYLFTNYSRNSTGPDTDYLVREDNSADELRVWEAARSTSAAPTYFAPYYHEKKRQYYIDGALHRNNPVQVLQEERRAIWSDKLPPDIILSIGTGVQANTDGATKSLGKGFKLAKKLIPKGLKGKIAVGLDMVQSTLDCERQWNEFISSIRSDDSLSRICHRLNIGLAGRPPDLDDINSIGKLRYEAEKYLQPSTMPYLSPDYKSAHAHVKIVAQRLTAALFYFEPLARSDSRRTGMLHCRLSSSMHRQFGDLLGAGPSFRACHRTAGGSWSFYDLQPNFNIDSFSSEIQFVEKSEKQRIEMRLPHWPSWEPISGHGLDC